MSEFYFAGIAFIIALSVGRMLLPSIIFVSTKRKLFDAPNIRKLHTRQISRLGGISFLPASVIGYSCALVILDHTQPELITSALRIHASYSLLFVIGFVIIFLTGIIDDLSGMTYRRKFLMQTLAAIVVIAPVLYIKSMCGILNVWHLSPAISIPASIILVILIINSYNLIDGVDGLCSGLAIVTITTLSIALNIVGSELTTIFSSAFLGIITAFFCYNVFGRKLKIFMGDSGSLIIGYVIAYLAFRYINISHNNISFCSYTFPIVVGSLFIPVFDATRLFVFRMIKGNSPFMPDKNHVHHKFIAIGFSHMQTTFSIVFLQIGYILLNISLTNIIDVNIILFLDICIGLGINTLLNMRIKGISLAKKVR